jgi:uncharacterized repeat protein (TIGR01451 family)
MGAACCLAGSLSAVVSFSSLAGASSGPAPAPALTITDTSAPVLAGQPVSVTLVVTASGTLSASDVELSDVLPQGATYLAGSASVLPAPPGSAEPVVTAAPPASTSTATSTAASTSTAAPPGNPGPTPGASTNGPTSVAAGGPTLTWTLPDLARGASESVTFSYQLPVGVAPGDQVSDQATVRAASSPGVSADEQASVTANNPVGAFAATEVAGTPLGPSSPATWLETVTVTGTGSGSVGDVGVDVYLPGALTFVGCPPPAVAPTCSSSPAPEVRLLVPSAGPNSAPVWPQPVTSPTTTTGGGSGGGGSGAASSTTTAPASTPVAYTHVHWALPSLAPGATEEFSYELSFRDAAAATAMADELLVTSGTYVPTGSTTGSPMTAQLVDQPSPAVPPPPTAAPPAVPGFGSPSTTEPATTVAPPTTRATLTGRSSAPTMHAAVAPPAADATVGAPTGVGVSADSGTNPFVPPGATDPPSSSTTATTVAAAVVAASPTASTTSLASTGSDPFGLGMVAVLLLLAGTVLVLTSLRRPRRVSPVAGGPSPGRRTRAGSHRRRRPGHR